MTTIKRTAPLTDTEGNHSGWLIFCPGCKAGHLFDQRWTFNGDSERPTFRASMLVNATLAEERNPDGTKKYPWAIRCHSFVTDGRIQFLGDCQHELVGQTVDLPDINEW